MNSKHRKSRPYHPHTKAERALTLAVLTALLSGAAVTPAMARDRTIEKDETVWVGNDNTADHRACLIYKDSATEKESDTNNITNNTSGNTLTILGTVASSSWPEIAAAYSGGQMSSLTTMYSSEAARLSKVLSTAAGPRAAM